MSLNNSVMNPAAGQLQLGLMDSRVAHLSDEYFLDRFRRLDLLHSEVISRIANLLGETRVCGGRSVHLGKIIVEEILQFVEQNEEVVSGLQVQAALHALSEAAPFLAPVLSPLLVEVESQGYGEAFHGSGFLTHLNRRAGIYFNNFANVLNLTRNMMTGGPEDGLTETFESPEMFALDHSENPFDLEDLTDLSPLSQAVAKFLTRLALAEGKLSDSERVFLMRMMKESGKSITESQFERILTEAARESLDQILAPVKSQSGLWKEKLLVSGMLMVAADGKVDVVEKKLLVQACNWLGISRERYTEISREAVAMIKSFRRLETQAAGVGLESSVGRVGIPLEMGSRSATLLPGNVPKVLEGEAARGFSRPTPESVPREAALAADAAGTNEPPAPVVLRAASETPVPTTTPRRLWYCPACSKPQFQDFAECPQCGVIVRKFPAAKGGAPREPVVKASSAIPPIPESRVPQKLPVPNPDPVQAPTAASSCRKFCIHCGESLGSTDKFCTSCGNRIEVGGS